jgi:hypothetical protein
MPLADLTAIANLALSHLGEPFLDDWEFDSGTAAEAVRLHLPQCTETVLEGHVWSFATRSAVLTPLDRHATVTIDPAGADNAVTFAAATAGVDGNDLSVRYVVDAAADVPLTTASGYIEFSSTISTLIFTVDSYGISFFTSKTTSEAAAFVAANWDPDATTTAVADGDRVTFTAKQAGTAGNDYEITVATGVGVDASGATLTGGTNGPGASASLDGDDITISVSPMERLVITGPTDPEGFGNQYVRPAPVFMGYSAWSTTGDNVSDIDVPAGQLVVFNNSGIWRVARMDETYFASITSSAESPVGLTGWTVYTGDGDPVITTDSTLTDRTALDVIAAVEASEEVSALITAELPTGTTGLGAVATVAATDFTGGLDAIAGEDWPAEYLLPSDCLRLLKIAGWDIDAPRNRFEIQGRYLLLPDLEDDGPRIHYITDDPPVSEWPTTFTDAVAFLLASRLAPLLTQDQNLAGAFLTRHEQALGKARSKDARETRSKENHGPRAVAARSGLVNARFSRSTLPPYA